MYGLCKSCESEPVMMMPRSKPGKSMLMPKFKLEEMIKQTPKRMEEKVEVEEKGMTDRLKEVAAKRSRK